MTIAVAVVFVAVVAAVAGICEDATLGLDHWHCQPCGSPGLNSFCVKKEGHCSRVIAEVKTHSNVGKLGPEGYKDATEMPKSCAAIKKAIEAKKAEIGTPSIYLQTKIGLNYMPRIYFNPNVAAILKVKRPLHDCLENDLPNTDNGRWNWANPWVRYYTGERLDSFFFEGETAEESHWSYQCYCDFCNNCQKCGGG